MEGAFLSRPGRPPLKRKAMGAVRVQSPPKGPLAPNARSGAASRRKGDADAILSGGDGRDRGGAGGACAIAARRAARTGGGVEILALIPRQEFVQWGAVQEAMEEEARLRAEAMLVQASGAIIEEAGIKPAITSGRAIRSRRSPSCSRNATISRPWCSAPRAEGGPGPLVSHFAGAAAGSLPCPLIIVPAGLDDEALDRLT